MNIEELEFVEGGVFADAIPVLRACEGLSLPSDVPVGALREVVEALRAMEECFDSERARRFFSDGHHPDGWTMMEIDACLKTRSALAKLNPSPTTEEK